MPSLGIEGCHQPSAMTRPWRRIIRLLGIEERSASLTKSRMAWEKRPGIPECCEEVGGVPHWGAKPKPTAKQSAREPGSSPSPEAGSLPKKRRHREFTPNNSAAFSCAPGLDQDSPTRIAPVPGPLHIPSEWISRFSLTKRHRARIRIRGSIAQPARQLFGRGQINGEGLPDPDY